jgi:stearoyl-CoA desaturase (delta-9 desaturase)
VPDLTRVARRVLVHPNGGAGVIAAVKVILAFFVLHWVSSVFFQTFFLHRYGAHRMFKLSPFWERVFYFGTFVTQGSSYLNPRAYAILHREHHAFSDTERDPHSPHVYKGLWPMMWNTALRYGGFVRGTIEPEARFAGWAPEWKTLDYIGDLWLTRIAFGVAYTSVYLKFAPHWAWFLLVPLHWIMGPLHGAIVNWCGHKYGYRNFATSDGDKSRNTLPFDFVTMGELFQNNHHAYGMSPNFAARWFEVDPTWAVIRALAFLRIVQLPANGQRIRWSREKTAEGAKPKPALPVAATAPALSATAEGL